MSTLERLVACLPAETYRLSEADIERRTGDCQLLGDLNAREAQMEQLPDAPVQQRFARHRFF